jgi:protein TonB
MVLAPGKYTVVVTFTVDKEGNVSDVQADNDPGFGTKDEAYTSYKKRT